MGKTVISFKNVSKNYYIYRKNIQRILGFFFDKEPVETKHALKKATFNIERGERVILIGLLESGRTTIQKLIAEIVFPSRGKVKIDGKVNAFLTFKVGMDLEQTCRENIYLKGNLVGLSRKQIKEHEQELIEFAGIEKYIDVPMKGAPKEAVPLLSLAISLLPDCDILLVGKVFDGGGKVAKIKCEEKLRQYLEEHPERTLIFVSTNDTYAKSIGTRGILLKEGEIVFDGGVEEAFDHYNVIRGKKSKVVKSEEPDEDQEEGDEDIQDEMM